ncbi:MAG TPA: LDL receptor domain-containing protein [Polyangiaceae bacterium]|nr:LDL receptor domain-containing protein [Polyangiaceae bacterium]
MRQGGVLVCSLFLLIGCSSSSDDKKSEAQQACEDRAKNLTACGLVSQQACGSLSTCLLLCQAHATCNQLTESPPTGTYLSCQAECQGVGSDPFLCKNGQQFLDARGHCDGIPECDDGSDEEGCGTGDAGSGGSPGSGGGNGSGGASAGGASSGGTGTTDGGDVSDGSVRGADAGDGG